MSVKRLGDWDKVKARLENNPAAPARPRPSGRPPSRTRCCWRGKPSGALSHVCRAVCRLCHLRRLPSNPTAPARPSRDGRRPHLGPRERLRLAGNATACSSARTTSPLWHVYWRTEKLRNKAKGAQRIVVLDTVRFWRCSIPYKKPSGTKNGGQHDGACSCQVANDLCAPSLNHLLLLHMFLTVSKGRPRLSAMSRCKPSNLWAF
jgi:hypothetical protein